LNDQDAFEADAPAQPDTLPATPAAATDTQIGTETPAPALAEAAGAAPAEPGLAPEAQAPAASDEPAPEPDSKPLFTDTGLSDPIIQAITEKGYLHPTPIQAQAIPVVLAGRDVLGVAQTGTGKTASFVLPMMDILSGSRARARMPRSLILEPTRELALQVAENFVLYGKHLKLNHALLIGGESLNDQKDALMKGVDVLIATPGRLLDLFERGGLLLTDCRVLVIDEADRMLDMGFIPDVEKIVGFLPKNRQTLFFSATMSPEIERLTKAFLTNPKTITVSKSATVATTIVAGLTLTAEHDKREALRRLIRSEDVQNALIFCNRKRDVDVLYKSLTKHGFSVGSLHGDMPQPARFATLEKFKANEIRLLVCSDVAARGIDIGGLSHVFNFDVPHHAEDYVHRIGRTGRAGKTGTAFTLAGPEDRLAVEAIEKLTGGIIPRIQVPGLDVVDWAEADGRKRRGRGGSSRGDRAPRGDKPKDMDAPRARAPEKAPTEKTHDAEPRPSRSRDRNRDRDRDRDRPAHPELAAAIRDEVARPTRDDAARSSRDDARPARDEGHRNHRDRRPDPVPEPMRAESRPPRERRWRDDDLGPSVVGFGDEIPAFMLLPKRGNRVHEEAA
jgi:superfamily II DNA/RNA helicase